MTVLLCFWIFLAEILKTLFGKAYSFVLCQVLILSSKLVNSFGWYTKLQNESTLKWLSGKAYNFVLFQVLTLSSRLVNLFGWYTKLQNESTLCNDEWLLETELSISQFNIWIHTRLHIFITTFTTHKKIYHKFFSHLLKLVYGLFGISINALFFWLPNRIL